MHLAISQHNSEQNRLEEWKSWSCFRVPWRVQRHVQCIAMSCLFDFRTVIHSHWNCRANEHCYWNWLETWKGRKEKKTHTRQIRVFTFFFETKMMNTSSITADSRLEMLTSPNEKKIIIHVDLPLLSGLKPWFRAQSPFVRYRNSRLFRYHH